MYIQNYSKSIFTNMHFSNFVECLLSIVINITGIIVSQLIANKQSRTMYIVVIIIGKHVHHYPISNFKCLFLFCFVNFIIYDVNHKTVIQS